MKQGGDLSTCTPAYLCAPLWFALVASLLHLSASWQRSWFLSIQHECVWGYVKEEGLSQFAVQICNEHTHTSPHTYTCTHTYPNTYVRIYMCACTHNNASQAHTHTQAHTVSSLTLGTSFPSLNLWTFPANPPFAASFVWPSSSSP